MAKPGGGQCAKSKDNVHAIGQLPMHCVFGLASWEVVNSLSFSAWVAPNGFFIDLAQGQP